LEEIDMLAANSAVAARVACVLACVGIAASGASAQWDPQNGQYRKTDSRDLRVMTWNIRDRICSTGNKLEGINGWTAESRIVAAMRPDVLIMQETGDNSANGTGTTIDSVAALTTTLGLFMRGGFDPVNNVQVTAYVQKWASSSSIQTINSSVQPCGKTSPSDRFTWALTPLRCTTVWRRHSPPLVHWNLPAAHRCASPLVSVSALRSPPSSPWSRAS
jgi:hypothetical protein